MVKKLSQTSGFQAISVGNGATVVVNIPNDVIDGDGFYISYNDRDWNIYGSDTTALVKGQMEAFYILKGNHMAEYSLLIENGFDSCMEYFVSHLDSIAPHSETPPTGTAPSM